MAERKCLQKQQWWNSGQALKLDNGLIQHCWGQKDQEGPPLGTEFVRLTHNLRSQSVQSCVRLFSTPCTAAHQASLSITKHLELAQTHVHRVGDAIQPSHSLSSLFLLPSIFPSNRVFSNESVLHIRWPKYWSFSFSINPSKEYSELISFRIDWLDLLDFREQTLKSLLQHHSSKVSVLQHSTFFIPQLSHPYMTTGKTIALTRQTFVDKVVSLLFIYLFYLFFFFYVSAF